MRSPERGSSRRDFLRRLAAVGALAATGAAGVGYAFEIEPRRPALEQVTVRLPSLPRACDGLRIAQLSDLHRGPLTGPAEIARAIDLAAGAAPDLVVLTGDYVTERADYAAELIPELARLAKAPLGVYAVLGNHDHWTGPAEVTAHLQAAGVRVLRNEAVRLAGGEDALWLVGVDDVWEGQDDLPAALASVPDGAPVVLLAHEPDFADTAAQYGVMLQLSGHSHGGQVRLPGIGAPVLPRLGRKYPIGLQRAGGTWVYTNRGVGTTPMGMRFNCRPEVTLVTLASELPG